MNHKGVAQLLLSAAVWSGYYMCTQYLNERASMFAVGGIVKFVTIVIMLLFFAAKGEFWRFRTPLKARFHLAMVGVVCFVLDMTAFIGFSRCSVAEGTAILKCDIIFVNLISAVLYKKFPSWRNWALTFMMLSGVFILIGIDLGSLRLDNVYCLFFLVSAFAASCNAFLVQWAQRRFPGIDNMAIAAYNVIFSGLCFIIFSLFEGSLIPSAALLFGSGSTIFATVLGAVMNVALFLFYYKCLREFSVWLVKIFLLTMPVFSAAAGYLLFGDALGLRQLAGIVVIILGALLTIRSEMTRQENLNQGQSSH